MLVEIAFWKSIFQFREMLKEARGENIDPEIIKSELIQKAKDDLPHMIGQAFADAIISCLTWKELTAGLDEFQVNQEFKKRVVQKLGAA